MASVLPYWQEGAAEECKSLWIGNIQPEWDEPFLAQVFACGPAQPSFAWFKEGPHYRRAQPSTAGPFSHTPLAFLSDSHFRSVRRSREGDTRAGGQARGEAERHRAHPRRLPARRDLDRGVAGVRSHCRFEERAT